MNGNFKLFFFSLAMQWFVFVFPHLEERKSIPYFKYTQQGKNYSSIKNRNVNKTFNFQQNTHTLIHSRIHCFQLEKKRGKNESMSI
jgi:hypothetical protein